MSEMRKLFNHKDALCFPSFFVASLPLMYTQTDTIHCPTIRVCVQLTQKVAQTFRCFHSADGADDVNFSVDFATDKVSHTGRGSSCVLGRLYPVVNEQSTQAQTHC